MMKLNPVHRGARPVVGRCVLLAVASMALGCDSGPNLAQMGTVSGAVTFNGAPVEQGQVVFENQDPNAAKPKMIAMSFMGGTYSMGGLPAGKYNVLVLPQGASTGPADPIDPTKPPPPVTEVKDIPEQYRSAASSGLSTEIKPGNGNKFDITMK